MYRRKNKMKNKIILDWSEFDKLTEQIIKSGAKFDGIYGVPRGGLVLAVYLSHKLNIPLILYPTLNTLVVDDISDEGKTLSSLKNRKIATLFSTPWTKIKPDWYVKTKSDKNTWIIFPWENQETEIK